MSTDRKVAVITGASRGIGAALVRAYRADPEPRLPRVRGLPRARRPELAEAHLRLARRRGPRPARLPAGPPAAPLERGVSDTSEGARLLTGGTTRTWVVTANAAGPSTRPAPSSSQAHDRNGALANDQELGRLVTRSGDFRRRRPRAGRALTVATSATTTYHAVAVGGVRVFYREAGPPEAPTLLLLHGYPSSSRQFDGLIPLLADRYRVWRRIIPASDEATRRRRRSSTTPSTTWPR